MRTALAIIVCALVVAAPAQAAQTPNQILSDLAAQQTHSWIDNGLGVDELVRRYKAGQRLNVTCGYVSEVARRLLREAGYQARRVGTVTLEQPDGLNDGHAMVEVFDEGRWQLYDVDANARSVDADGAGVSLVDQIAAVRAGTALWEPIASDPLFREDEPDEALREAVRKVFADPDGFYRRVMGFALLPRDQAGAGTLGMWYIDAGQTSRINQYWPGRYHLATSAQWAVLTSSTVVPAIPAVAAKPKPVVTKPAAPVASVPKPVVTVVKQRPCQRLKRRWRRTHSRTAHRRYLRCKARH